MYLPYVYGKMVVYGGVTAMRCPRGACGFDPRPDSRRPGFDPLLRHRILFGTSIGNFQCRV